ncbi:tetratricopeptide repeat protein 37 [Ochlerotatus camptorhynchus]|uniref:tetratricopeptide repeat protein 37 n=1 Tax=Ochlerotatus camptorhynchus TaxID=644619 RepID=UPI0031CF1667
MRMSSKEIKAALKDAREAVKNKKFSDAIKLCNKILKEDAENYMALLLMGASHQEADNKKAANFLKRALACNNDPTVALQGLANCADDADLPDVCGRLLELTPEKYVDLHQKLEAVARKGVQVNEVVKLFVGEIENNQEVRKISAFTSLSRILLQNQSLEEKYETLIERILEHETKNENDPFLNEKFKRYLKLLHRLKMYEKLVQKASMMYNRFQGDIYPLEWICKVYAEKLIEEERMKTLVDRPFYTYFDAAIQLNPESALALVARGIRYYREGELKQAEAMLSKVDTIQPNWDICLKELAEIYCCQKAYGLAENIYRRMKIVNENFFVTLIEDGDQEKLKEAHSISDNVLKGNNSSEMLFYDTKLKLLLGHMENHDDQFEKLKTANMSIAKLDYLNALRFIMEGRKTEAQEILQKHEDDCECLLELTNIYYSNSNVEQSFVSALRATKLQPNNAKCFYWLGKLYVHNADTTRARKCLEKCVSLNPSHKEAIILLSSLYRTLSEWEANHKLLQNTVSLVGGSGSAWAQLQLGLHHLGQQSYDEAIAAFRTVIRYDVDNITSWEGLADAYMGRGSFTSAMKVFEKTAELKPDNPYPKLQLANIKNILKQHRDAIPLFEELLASNDKYFPAVKGIAEAHAGLCYYHLGQRLVGKSRDHAQSCVDFLTRAIKIKPNFVCLWKILGNVLDTVAEFPQPRAHLLIEGSLAGVSHRRQALLEGEKLYVLASRCYSRALKLNQDNSLLWYELASNQYRRALRFGFSQDDNQKLLQSAAEAAKQSIKLEPNRWQNWNLLGVISASKEINNLALAQHCFIEAISLDKKTAAVGWSNLGVMYLLQGSTSLANKAFGRAQQTDTTYMNAWIGQALIAETIGQADEAMDLFRHCTQLGYHAESALGYPHWVCSVLGEDDYRKNKHYQFAIENMHALPVSHDSIVWHCADKHDEASVEALRFLGNISSRLGLWRTASDAFQKAANKADGVQKDYILCDLGYCLLKQKKYVEAVECYQQVAEATYHATIGKALAFFKAGQYQESYAEYESALNWLATTDLEKAYVLIAMSAMVYAFQGEADAKTILFQCITLPEPPIEALFSACALGLLHKDTVLTELVIKELRKYENSPKHGHHVVYLVSQFFFFNKQKTQSLAYLISQVHKFPDRPKLRQILAVSLLKNHRTPKQNLIVASSIAESALVLDLHDKQRSTRARDAANWLAVASEAVRPVDERRRKVLAQKAVHVDPTCKEAWSSLIRILNPKKI